MVLPDDPMTLGADVLRRYGFAHGFSTRRGGVSLGAYASMNLGGAVGDDPEAVRENHRRLAARVGYAPERLRQTLQVHGAAVYAARSDDTPNTTMLIEADALVARVRGDAVAVRVADCVPVLLADLTTGAVAAVHAGWRGVTSKVIAAAHAVLTDGDAGVAESVVAALGPSIGPCCFEVGHDVAAEIAAASTPDVVRGGSGNERPKVDLWRAVERQLQALGVRSIERVGGCTRCEIADFHSFRRDGPRSGRMVGVIVARGTD